jgi:leucyl aminopeptidase
MRFAPLLSALAAAAALAAPSAQAATTWITLGERAYMLLVPLAPEARVLSTRRVPVIKPELRGSSTLVNGSEMVLAVEVDESALEELTGSVHQALHKCGGYARHESEAEALAVLAKLGTAPVAQRLPSYTIDNPAAVNARLPLMQSSNILSTIEQLAAFQNRRYNSSHGVAASDWLFNQWTALNVTGRRNVKVTQITHAGWAQKSVELLFQGAGNSGETIVLGAHLDSINGGAATAETQRAPGADDDASGVASLTEIIRVMLATNYQPKRNIRFIAYAAEEVGLRGSQAVVAAQAGRRDRVVGVLQLDMTAFQGDATDLWIYTDFTSPAQNQFIASLAAFYLPTLTVGYDFCGYGCSDHASWHNAGYPVSFPFEASDNTFNFALHTTQDTTATFGNQADHALKFARLGMAFAVELASDGPAPAPTAKAAAPAAATATALAAAVRTAGR